MNSKYEEKLRKLAMSQFVNNSTTLKCSLTIHFIFLSRLTENRVSASKNPFDFEPDHRPECGFWCHSQPQLPTFIISDKEATITEHNPDV